MTVKISNRGEYEAANARASSLTDGPEGSAAAAEQTELTTALRAWDQAHKGENSQGPEPVEGLTRPDDFSVSGLPGNLGKLHDT